VAWEIDKKQEVRVYEARSPQQAWQAAVLEKIGKYMYIFVHFYAYLYIFIYLYIYIYLQIHKYIYL
jgi:hypothetical protein